LDAEGQTLRHHEGALPTEMELEAALARFRGEILQEPPMFSAVKHHGVPLHRLPRQGRVVERAAKSVRIDRLVLGRYEPPDFDVEVECSAGTYVRVLAQDLGRVLGRGAHLRGLRRTASGPFAIEQAHGEAVLAAAAERGELESLLSAAGVT